MSSVISCRSAQVRAAGRFASTAPPLTAASTLPSVGLVLALLILVSPTGLAAGQDSSPAVRSIELESLAVTAINESSASFRIQLRAIAGQSAVIRELVLEDVSINGVPVSVPPVFDTITLRKGELIEKLPPFDVTVSFRHLDSLSPIRRAVSAGTANVKATLRVRVQLSVFQKLVLFAGNVWVSSRVDQDVPVELPGGPAGKTLAIATLMAAEPAWFLARTGLSIVMPVKSWTPVTADLDEARNVALIETRYTVRTAGGETAPLTHRALAYVDTSSDLFATAESIEPWLFESDLAQATRRGDVRIDNGGLEIIAILPLTGEADASQFSLQNKTLGVRKRLKGSELAVISGSNVRYDIRLRDRDNNLARLSLKRAKLPADSSHSASQDTPPETPWSGALIFRVRTDQPGHALEVRQIGARVEGGRIRLDEPVDGSAYGSPIMVNGKIVGILQDADSGVLIENARKQLK